MDFDVAFERLIGHEGGYTNNPADPGNWTGGRVGVGQLKGTKFGIAANTYPDLDIAGLTFEQAKAIYRRDYWDRCGGDAMHPAIVYQVFDAAVNSGVTRAVIMLQRAVGVAEDGKIGPITVSAVNAMSVSSVLLLYNAERLRFLASLQAWATFGRGWARRVADNLVYAAGDA